MTATSKRYLLISAALLFVCICIGFFTIFRSHPKELLFSHPVWQVGDWFEIEFSHREDLPRGTSVFRRVWTPRERRRFTVIGIKSFGGYPCFVLQESSIWSQTNKYWFPTDRSFHSTPPEIPSNISEKPIENPQQYFFRCSDMQMIAMKTKNSNDSLFGLPPWVYSPCPTFEAVPAFPIYSNTNRYVINDNQLWDNYHLPPVDSIPAHLNSSLDSIEQTASLENVNWGHGKQALIRVEVGNKICRWVPGQLWWVQCWEKNSTRPLGFRDKTFYGSHYRAVLVKTSRDGALNYPFPAVNKENEVVDE